MRKAFILVAEDDADDRFLLQTAFQENGFTDTLEFVENGVDLIEFLENLVEAPGETVFPGVILLDLNMPKKGGREVLQEIKQHRIFKSIPVVVYTTTKSEAEVKRCYELGANSYIVKPTRFDALLKVVVNLRAYWFDTVTIPAYL